VSEEITVTGSVSLNAFHIYLLVVFAMWCVVMTFALADVSTNVKIIRSMVEESTQRSAPPKEAK